MRSSTLVLHPDFAAAVDDIVVAFRTASDQGVLDRFLEGEDVPERELRQVWCGTSQLLMQDAPVHEQFFATVRAVNQRLP